jgi:hypothetical protein
MAAGSPKGWTAAQVALRDRIAQHIERRRAAGRPILNKEGKPLRGPAYGIATRYVKHKIDTGGL